MAGGDAVAAPLVHVATPVTVTVCAVLQLDGVKVAGFIVTVPASPDSSCSYRCSPHRLPQ